MKVGEPVNKRIKDFGRPLIITVYTQYLKVYDKTYYPINRGIINLTKIRKL